MLTWLTALAASAAAVASGSSLPGLHAQPPDGLPPGGFGVQAEVGLERYKYPDFGLGFAQGMGGGLEFSGQGLFHHMRFASFGELHQYDFDETQASLKWTVAGGGRGGGLAVVGGWSGFTERIIEGAASEFTLHRTYRWGDAIAGIPGPAGSRASVTVRGLEEHETGAWVTAAIVAVEFPPLGKLTPLGDYTRFLKRPPETLRPWPSASPWAAGFRMAMDGGDLLVYWSNTWGTTAPDALYGEDIRFLNVRLALRL